MISSRLLVVPLVCAALAGGCGGDDDGGGGGKSATEWADGVCSAIGDWTGSIQEATDSLRGGNLSENQLKQAGDDIGDATDEFVDDLKGLGRPDLEGGEEAEQSLDQLADDVDEGVAKIEGAADDVDSASSAAQAFSTVSAALTTMSQAIAETFRKLEQLDAGQELKDAFEDADACKDLSKE